MGPPFRVQFRARQPGTHSRIPFTRYCESDTMTSRNRLPLAASSSKANRAPINAIRLLVVSGSW